MSDYGAQYTARVQRGLEIRLQRLFTEAQSDMLKKLDGFTAQFMEKDKKMLAKLEAGEITKEKYDRWVAGQVFQGAQWEQKLKDMTDSLSDYYGEALEKIHDKQIDVFSKNANYQAYCMEHDIGKDFGFDLYDASTVERLMKETPELLPRKIVNRKKHNHWNQGIINNCITQGVIQGESIPQIARRISNTVANADMKSATLYARTAMTSAQNGGRMERLKEAKEMGINVKKQWLAIVDGRTRDSHIHLDGQIQDVSKPFKSDFGRLDFPGDPKGAPADVYNCRCTLVYVFPEHEDMSQYPDWERAKGMTYPEWEEEKQKSTSIHGMSKKEYYKAMNERDSVLDKETREADEWYAKEKDRLSDEYGGSFVSQRVSVRRDGTLTDEEKDQRLAELKTKEKEYLGKKDKLTEQYYKKLEEAHDKHDAVFMPEYEYKKIKGKHSIEQDCGAVNKKYMKEPGHDTNCVKCAVAFEMRQKGYDVVAEPWEGSLPALYRIFPKAERFERTGKGHHNTVAVMGKMKEWGEGSRAIAVIQREVGSGHAFNVMQKDGMFWIVDGQIDVVRNNGESGINMYGRALEDLMTTHVSLIRVDNQDAYEIPVDFLRRNIND